MKTLRYLLPLAAGAALFGSSDANATDPSIYLTEAAGSVCQPRSGVGSANYNAFGAIANEHTTQILQTDCPIPFIVDNDYGDQLDVSIHVRGNGSPLTCTIFVEKLTTLPSSPTFFSASGSTSAIGPTTLNLDINVFEGLSAGVMHVFCTLPARNTNGSAEVRGFLSID